MVFRTLVIDANNLLYRTFFGQMKEDVDVLIGLCHHSALWSMLKYYRTYPADEIVMAFDSYSWRKLYTKNLNECVTYKKYKGNRRLNLSSAEENKLKIFDEHVQKFAEMLKTQTSILVLQKNYLEADDLIAEYIQRNPDYQHVLISSDKDYIQLLGNSNLTIIDPDSNKPRTLAEWNNDPNLFMFNKCLRGDQSDNVMSAYPRLRTTKIFEAYSDEYARETIMKHTFKALINSDDDSEKVIEKEFLTEEVFAENNLLMNLYEQPEYIKTIMRDAVDEAIANKGKFDYMKFIKFCGKYDLVNILNKVDEFVPMLAMKKIKA